VSVNYVRKAFETTGKSTNAEHGSAFAEFVRRHEEKLMDTPLNSQNSDRQHEEELTSAVLRYLAEHPQAMDTFEGIAEWWIARQQIRVEVTTLARVLHRLVERGLLEVTGSGEYARYSLKPESPEP
jgi:Fe2+ or Zn2+ uptake regulation protein